MLSCCSKCKKKKKIQTVLIQELLQLVIWEQWYYQNVPYVAVKNQNLLKNKKKKDY